MKKTLSVIGVLILTMVILAGAVFAQQAERTKSSPVKVTTVSRAVEVTTPAPAAPSFLERMFTIGFVQDMIQIILLTALPLLFTGIGWLIYRVLGYLDKAADNIDSELGKKAAHKVIDVLRNIVDRIGASQRKKLEAKLADGKITKEEFKEQMTSIGKDAIEEAKETVGIKTMTQAEKEFKDFTGHMGNALESYVEQKKTNSSITLSPVALTPPADNTTSTAKAA